MCYFGRAMPPTIISVAKKHNYFDKADWLKWLDFVGKFYREYKSINNAPTTNLSPLFVERTFDNRPFISVNLFGENITALLDSGANVSVIGISGISIIEGLQLKINPSLQRNISTADGISQAVTGIIDLPLRIDSRLRIIGVLVVPSIKHTLVLGSDFCKQFQLKIDYKSNSWHIQCDECVDNLAINNALHNSISYNLCNLDSLLPEQRVLADGVVQLFKEISSEKYLGRTSKISLAIDTGDAPPFKLRQYPFSPFMLNILNKELDSMLELDVVEPSHSSWNSPVLLVKKKSGEYRFCFDGRRLNSVTKRDAYPLPRVDSILSMLRDAKYISSIDLRKAFWQIPLQEDSKEKTAFSVPGRGLFHFKVVPFGFVNSAQCQQRLMDVVFGPKLEPKVFCYLDDIIVTSSSFEEHIEILNEVFLRLKEANLSINLEKCEFFKKSLKYLGFVVDGTGLRTDPEKVSCMLNYPRPVTTTEVKRFVGMTSWYRKFICHFSTLMSPLNDLIKAKKKKEPITWTPEAEASFVKLKQALVSAPILNSPDFARPFIIQCDASDTGLGGVLTQNKDGQEVVIAFASRSLSQSERKYPVTQKECLAVIFSIEKFRPYIEGTHFTVISDHYSLIWLHNLKEPTGKLARWAVKLQQYDFDIIHRKGKLNVVPDALSRIASSEISVLDINLDNLDKFYVELRNKITEHPELYPQWKIQDGLVYKSIPHSNSVPTNANEWKLLVPKPQRVEIIKSFHEPPTSAHFGFYKTCFRVQEIYYWPKMRHDILKFVRSCKMCGAQKAALNSRNGIMRFEKTVDFPWQIIAVDILGPLPRSKKGNCYLLVISDWFSKYTLLHPMRKATAENIIKFMENEIFLVFGVPQFIICDNGTQFAGKEFKKLAENYQVQKIWYNARYHPQCNFVERVNRTIGAAVRSYVKDHKDWDKEIKKIAFAINTSKHESTGYPPVYLNFGRYVPIDGTYYGKIQNTENMQLLPSDRNQYSSKLKGISQVFDEVKERLHNAYKKNSATYNLRRRDVEFKVGEKVWRRNKVLSDASKQFASKLAPKYVLCTVKRKISRLIYALSNTDGTDAGEWHVKDLKTYLGSNSDISVG